MTPHAARICGMARHALPLMDPVAQREVESLCNALEKEPAPVPGKVSLEELMDFERRRAAAAWERDMGPVRGAIVGALQQGDLAALRGLRGLLGPLLSQVNAQPALADLLAVQLGQEILAAFQTPPEEAR